MLLLILIKKIIKKKYIIYKMNHGVKLTNYQKKIIMKGNFPINIK